MDKNLVGQLYAQAQKEGLVMALYNVYGKSIFVSLPFGEKILQKQIEEMDFSARSYNCLKRKNVNTVDDLVELLDMKIYSEDVLAKSLEETGFKDFKAYIDDENDWICITARKS